MSRTLYAATSSGLFRSTDAGETWAAADAGLPTNYFVSARAIDPSTPGTLYAGTSVGIGGGIFRSTDAGATWHATGRTTAVGEALIIDPIMSSTLYALAYLPHCELSDDCYLTVIRSTDGGSTWRAPNPSL
jgi:hypothetical protein